MARIEDLGLGKFQQTRSTRNAAPLQVSRDRAAMDAEDLGQILQRLAGVVTCTETIDFVWVKAALNEVALEV